jgi:3-mercaptopyruvate sulfurtransferase SseA
MKLELRDGMVVEGTATELKNFIELAADGSEEALAKQGWYTSSSKGLIRISSMDSMHIRNAIMVRFNAWVDELRRTHRKLSDKEFVDQLVSGAGADDVVHALAKELIERL